MKTIMAAVLVGCLTGLVQAETSNTITVTEGVDLTFRTGIPLDAFAAAWPQIAQQLPKDDAVLDVIVHSNSRIEIRTCKKGSHSRGTGGSFVFEKRVGKWLKTQTGSWVS